MIVVAKPSKIVEGGHFLVRPEEHPRQLFADSVEDVDAGLFFDTFGKQFLCSRSTFLRRRLIACLASVRRAFLFPAYMEYRSSFRSVHDHGWPRVWAFALLGNVAVLSFIQNIRLRFLRLPRRCVGNTERFFAGLFEWFHPNLHE